MQKTTLINMLYYAQREAFKCFDEYKELEEYITAYCEIGKRLLATFNNNAEMIKLYNRLVIARTEYDCKLEENAYCHGFKAGFQMAIELGMTEITYK